MAVFYSGKILMKLESDGVLIDMRPLGERDCIACIFTHDYGVIRAVIRGAVIAKKNRPLVGQVGAAAWNARLDSQLGVFHWEAARNMAAPLMADAVRLAMMNAVFALIASLLPERECYGALYAATVDFLAAMANSPRPVDTYLTWEAEFLRDIGYAMDLSSCAGCGTRENLNYMSPRTCRAVCDSCAAPYADRLFRLPMTMQTGFRLIERICAEQGAVMPPARQILNMY